MKSGPEEFGSQPPIYSADFSLSSLLISLFFHPPAADFLLSCFIARSHRPGGVSALLTVQFASFMVSARRVLRQAAAACDRVKHSIAVFQGGVLM